MTGTTNNKMVQAADSQLKILLGLKLKELGCQTLEGAEWDELSSLKDYLKDAEDIKCKCVEGTPYITFEEDNGEIVTKVNPSLRKKAVLSDKDIQELKEPVVNSRSLDDTCIALVIPTEDKIPADFFITFTTMTKSGKTRIVSNSSTPKNTNLNNLILTAIRDPKVEYVAIIEPKTIIQPDTLQKLLARNVDCVGALAFATRYPFLPNIYTRSSTQKGKFDVNYEYDEKNLIKVDYTSLDFLLIRADVLRKSSAKFEYSSGSINMEVPFFDALKLANVDIFVDPEVTIGRISSHIVTETNWKISKDTFIAQQLAKLKKSENAKEPKLPQTKGSKNKSS